MARAAALRDEVARFEKLQVSLDDLSVAFELASLEADADLSAEALREAQKSDALLSELEVSSWFSDELDSGDAIITITPGQGGLEAQDWTDMLFKMYLKYAENRGWKVDVHDTPAGEVIGLDRAVFTIHGHNAYGLLKSEAGTHRLVRISPTDVKKRRQTTFAGVSVLPVLPDNIAVELRDEDLRVDVYRSSGPGGQSVNTTDSAVRITHVPSGIVVTCQNEKSQHKNKDAALSILRARLYEEEKARREAELEELRGPKTDITWGSQIRNYVRYPYQLVKDLRSGIEKGNVEGVLAGDIDDFVIAYHHWKAAQAKQPAAVELHKGGAQG
jgi:peptide chain release factor 2